MISRSENTTHDPPTIKLFGPGSPQSVLTLRACFERYMRNEFLSSQSGTVSAYCTALNHWERHTANPDVSAVTKQTIRQFRDGMLATGLSNDTINKNWRHLRAVFRRIGPWESGNPQAEEIIDRPPHMKALPSRQKIPQVIDTDVINRIYRACDIAEWPNRSEVSPPILWRCALVLYCNYGMRTFDCWGLTWENIDWSLNRLTFVMKKTKRTIELPLNEVVRTHLRTVQENSPQLFPVTKDRGDLYNQWHTIQYAAGIHKKADHIDFRHLRETCNTWYERIKPGIGKWVLGHAAQGVNERYYLNLWSEIVDAVNQLEQPKAFLETSDSDQLLLF